MEFKSVLESIFFDERRFFGQSRIPVFSSHQVSQSRDFPLLSQITGRHAIQRLRVKELVP